MKNNASKILLLMLIIPQFVNAAGPIVPAATVFLKRLKRSVENPIDLIQSTDAEHADTLFTTRVISRLQESTLSAFDQTAVRNEICASSKIQATNAANSYEQTPAAIGIYLYEDNIVAIHDRGLMGERLDSVLHKLKFADDAVKDAYANSYVKEITRVIDAIHASDVTWNNVSLGNFYVQPDGTLTAIDLSAAKSSGAGGDGQDRKVERLNVVANVIRPLFEILFTKGDNPNPADGHAKFIALAGVGAGWRAIDWTQVNWNIISAGVAAAAAPTYLPAMDGLHGTLVNIARAQHNPAAGAGLTAAANMGDATGFVLDAAVLPFIVAPAGAAPWTNLTTMCAGW